MTLFDECIEALGKQVIILSQQKSMEISDLLENIFPIAVGGRIHWAKVKKTVDVFNDIEKIKYYLKSDILDKSPLYIIWDDGSLPVLISNLNTALDVIIDILPLGTTTWFFNPEQKYVIEFYFGSSWIIGWTEK